MGVGITGRTLEISAPTAVCDGLSARSWRAERVRSGSVRLLGPFVSRSRSRSKSSRSQQRESRQFLDDGRYRSVRPVLGSAYGSDGGWRYAWRVSEQRRPALY